MNEPLETGSPPHLKVGWWNWLERDMIRIVIQISEEYEQLWMRNLHKYSFQRYEINIYTSLFEIPNIDVCI